MAPRTPRSDGEHARVLVVETDDAARSDLAGSLGNEGYEVVAAATAEEAASHLSSGEDPVAALVASGEVAGILDIVSELAGSTVATVVLAANDRHSAKAALAAGADGYVVKPPTDTGVLLSLAGALQKRSSQSDAMDHAQRLEQMVRDRTGEVWSYVTKLEHAERDMRVLQEEFIHRLSIAAEFRDDESRRHVQRMSHYTALIADRLGWPADRCEMIRIASAMHDVGKIGIPDQILMKPGDLDEVEWEIMKRHCQIGHRVLSGSSSELLNLAATIALTHHEKIDGSGYPFGLSGEDIPAVGRMAAIADVFDALTSDKIYKRAVPFTEAFAILSDNRGTHFDAEMLDIFLTEKSRVLGIKERFADTLPGGDEMSELSALAADV